MLPIRILVFSAATFLMLCVAVTCQTPTSELQKVDLVSVPLNKQLLNQQMRNSNNYLNCNEGRKFCTNKENLEFGLCSAQSWAGWNHGKNEELIGNISTLFYEPVGPDGKPTMSYTNEEPWPNGTSGQNSYPSNGGYPWPINGLLKVNFVPNPNPFGTTGVERWFKFGEEHNDDRLVAQDKRWWRFNDRRDAIITLQYPMNGNDENTVVTYVLISITSDDAVKPSTAFIIEGGILQKFITINIFVYSTRLFGWAAQIFAFQ